MMRSLWDDEYEGESHQVLVHKYIKIADQDEFTGEVKPIYKEYIEPLPAGKPYYLLFTVKNRRGMDCNTGLDVLVLEPDFNSNQWNELGWCKIFRDRNYS